MLLILNTQKAGTNSINFLAKQFNVLILFQSTAKNLTMQSWLTSPTY